MNVIWNVNLYVPVILRMLQSVILITCKFIYHQKLFICGVNLVQDSQIARNTIDPYLCVSVGCSLHMVVHMYWHTNWDDQHSNYPLHRVSNGSENTRSNYPLPRYQIIIQGKREGSRLNVMFIKHCGNLSLDCQTRPRMWKKITTLERCSNLFCQSLANFSTPIY